MKKTIRASIIIALYAFVLPVFLFSQRYRTGYPTAGRTYAMQNFGIDNHLLLRLADSQVRTLDFERAILTLDNAVAQSPFSADALIQRAKLRKLLGMTAGANEDFRIAHRLNPYAADLYGYNGPQGVFNVLSIEPGGAILELSMEKRISYYYNLVENEFNGSEKLAEEWDMLVEVLAGIEATYLDEALNQLNDLLSLYPNSALAYDLKGWIFIQQGNYEAAREALKQAVILQPDLAVAWYNFSLIERQTGRYDRAKEYLDRAIYLQKDLTKAYFERALLSKTLGDHESALDDYDMIIALQDEGFPEALFNRGLTRKMVGDFSGALADMDRAVDNYPNRPELYINRANLYLFFGLPYRAIEDYTTAIRHDAFSAEAYYNRGLAYLVCFDLISGCRDLQKSDELGFASATEIQRYFCVE